MMRNRANNRSKTLTILSSRIIPLNNITSVYNADFLKLSIATDDMAPPL